MTASLHTYNPNSLKYPWVSKAIVYSDDMANLFGFEDYQKVPYVYSTFGHPCHTRRPLRVCYLRARRPLPWGRGGYQLAEVVTLGPRWLPAGWGGYLGAELVTWGPRWLHGGRGDYLGAGLVTWGPVGYLGAEVVTGGGGGAEAVTLGPEVSSPGGPEAVTTRHLVCFLLKVSCTIPVRFSDTATLWTAMSAIRSLLFNYVVLIFMDVNS